MGNDPTSVSPTSPAEKETGPRNPILLKASLLHAPQAFLSLITGMYSIWTDGVGLLHSRLSA